MERAVKREYNRLLSYIIAIVMLLSGMCLESSRSDFCSGYTRAVRVTFEDSRGTETFLGESCLLQLVDGKKKLSKEGFSNQTSKKREIRELALFLCAIILAYHFLNIREMERILQLPAKRGEGVISRYIHKQDGKKRDPGK